MAGASWEKIPGHAQAEQSIKKSANGSFRALCELGSVTLFRNKVIDAYRSRGHQVYDLGSINKLDLQVVDKTAPRLTPRYAFASAAQGAVSGAVMGGVTMAGAISGTVTSGVSAVPATGIVISTLVTDTAALIATGFREISHYAAYYGYDTREPGELAYALAVLQAASAGDQLAKQAAFIDLQRITLMVARRATWAELNKEPFILLATKMYGALNRRLIQRKISQITIGLGIAIGFGVNFRFMSNLGDHAYFLYRERFLREKYGIPDNEPPLPGESRNN